MRPEKIILHIDFNSFFASVEQQANPFLRGKAIAVAGKGKHSLDVAAANKSLPRNPLQGRGNSMRLDINALQFQRSVITTASREAKKRGVKTAMATWEARKLVPDLTIIPGDPQKYGEITSRMMAILRRHADMVEQFSTDEAFADITNASGGDYFGATLLGERIRADIKRECGMYCTASIGIANNRLLAKLASEAFKPNGFTVVPPEDAEEFVATRPLRDFCGIGPRVAKRLERLGVISVTTLRSFSLAHLTHEFKSYGTFLYEASRGRGSDLVNDDERDPKSVGHSYTFPFNLLSVGEVRKNLLALSDRVAWRMRKHGFVSTHLSAYVRYDDFSGTGAAKTFKEPIFDGLEILENAMELITPTLEVDRGIRLLGVSASGLRKLQGSVPLLQKERRTHNALLSLDKITEKYGSGTWQRASTIHTHFKERVSGWHYDHEA
jgi:DNA polymerase-4